MGKEVFFKLFFSLTVILSTGFQSVAKKPYLDAVNSTCGTSYGCGLCHVDPNGGKELTSEGTAYANSGNNSSYFCSTTNQAPVAVANANPVSGTAPLTVEFNSTGSTDSDGDIAIFSWSFGDGLSETGASTTYEYSSEGTFNSILTVTDNDGAIGKDTVTIMVTPPLPGSPTLVAPADGSSDLPLPLTLKWNSAENFVNYRLQVSSKMSFSTSVVDTTTTDTSCVLSTIASGETYYWRVSVSNDAGTSEFSTTFSFTIAVPVSLIQNRATDREILIRRDNSLSYTLDKKLLVSLRLYDMQGKLVYSLNKTRVAGRYMIDQDQIAPASGFYLLDFKAGDYTDRRAIEVK